MADEIPEGYSALPPGTDISMQGTDVTFNVRRCDDGTTVVAMTNHTIPNAPVFAMILRPETTLELLDFLINKPTLALN